MAVVASTSVPAVPSNPFPVVVRQPDGSVFRAIARGDEYQGWVETLDGYTIVRSTKTGFAEFATLDRERRLVPSGRVVRPADASGAKMLEPFVESRGLRPARNRQLERSQKEWIRKRREQRALAPGVKAADGKQAPSVTGTWAPRQPLTGEKRLLVILVEFEDQVMRPNAAAYWSNAIFGKTGATVAAFYRDNSFGRVAIAPVAHTQPGGAPGVVTVALPEKHPDAQNDIDFWLEVSWVNRSLAAAAKFVDFRALDSNRDGVISVDEALVYFILAGFEASTGQLRRPGIWAHRLGADCVGVRLGPNEDIRVDNWAVNGEMYDASTRMQIGVIAHEMGHAMSGLPDLYDTANKNAGLGHFSVMSRGSWGARPTDIPGAMPVGLDAWSRQYLGWSTPRYLKSGSSATFESGLKDPSSAVMLMNSATSTSEYWLLENRHPVGWDAGLTSFLDNWQGGLLIQHIDANVGNQADNSFNRSDAGPHQGNTVVEPAGAQCHLLRPNLDTCTTLLYFAGNGDVFDGTSNPASHYYSGNPSKIGITNVSPPGSSMNGIIVAP